MSTKNFSGWKGIDVRKLPTDSPMDTFQWALNVDLTVNGGIKSRDPFVKIATVHANAVGFYSLGGVLRCAIAGGHSITPPPGIVYDEIGDGGSAYPLNSVTELSGWETIGTSTLNGLMPYLVVGRSDGSFEHHWIQQPVFPSSVVPDTKIDLPFKAGPFLVKMVEKLWAIDTYNNEVPYSSVTNGPSDWTFPNDAGELPTADQTSGDRRITGLNQMEGQLIVFFENCVQAWNVYADPTNPNFGIQKVQNGPGTIAPYSVDNVRDDLWYFSAGAFRRLQKNLLTGQFREGDLGKEIYPLTKGIDVSQLTNKPFGRWFQSRQQYICFMGPYAYCYLNSTLDGQTNAGWTMWQLPGEVSFAAELDNILYVRIGNDIYMAVNGGDPTVWEPSMSYDVRTQFFNGGNRHVAKDWQMVEVTQLGVSQLSFFDDPTNPDAAPVTLDLSGDTVDGRTYTPVSMNSNHLGFGLSGTGLLQFEALDLQFDVLGL